MSGGGLSKARLGRMENVMCGYVESGEVAGVVTLLCRHDEVHVEAIGKQDLAAATPMRRDTIIVFVGVVALQPSDFRIVRSTTISAPAAVAFSQVNDFHRWEAWSPWAKMDPAAKNTFEGAPSGTGAIFAWAGNSKVGEGRMTLTESRPPELIRIKLEFVKPFAASNTAEFTFRPEGSQTVVTWAMSGTRNFIARAVCLFMNMDKTVGGEFEKGLAQVKAVAEAAASRQRGDRS
jgi:hypothetical protein